MASGNSNLIRRTLIALGTAAYVIIGSGAHAKINVIAFEDSVTGPNGDIGRLQDGMINNAGRVLFIGTDSEDDYGFGVALPEAAHYFVREGHHAPGTAVGVNFRSFDDDPQWSDLGQIAFRAELTGPGVSSSTNLRGLWAGTPNDLRLIAREGDLLPGSGAAQIDSVAEDFELGGDGYVAFTAHLTGNRDGIWAGTQGNLQAVAVNGEPAVGFPGMTYWVSDVFDDGLSLNHSNHLAFRAVAESELDIHDAIWTGTPGNLQVAAYSHMAAPEFAAGAEIIYFGNPPLINDANHVAFPVGVADPSNEHLVVETLYLHTSTGLTRMFDPNLTPPGYGPGSEYLQVLDYHFGNNDYAAMLNPVVIHDGETEDALFVVHAGEVQHVTSVGDQIPNASGDLHFEYIHQFFVNDDGEVAFFADVGGDDVQYGLWIGDGAGELREIARTGTALEIAPGDVRVVSDVTLVGVGFADPERTPFNDAGQLVFYAAFEDSTAALLLYSPAGTPGDYNGDSKVDAADYVVWRNHVGMDVTLPNDETPGSVDPEDYAVWKSHYGEGGGGAITQLSEAANVPEPASAVALIFCMSAIWLRRFGRR